MSSPAPILRIPIPGSRSNSGSRPPRLGLAIPPSPNMKPVNPETNQTQDEEHSQGGPPSLRLATPMGSSKTPLEDMRGNARGRRPPLQVSTLSADPSSDTSERSCEQLSSNSSAPQSGGGDGMSSLLPDLEKLSLEKGRPLDVEDLDDLGWRAASKEGRIEELGVLGEGAGGAVTRCRLKGAQTVFALKIITTDPNPDVKKQIVRELEFNKSCASEHICQYYGAFEDESSGAISFAMEYCEGGSLHAVYRKVKAEGGRTGEKVLGKVAEGVLKGLTYLHGHRIIHRDVKPSNILLCRDGQIKLCDFGVSGEFGTRGDATTFIGTSAYMAPERITGQSYTITSDVWSLGVTLLEVAQHRFPFPADGTEMQPTAAIIDLVTYIVSQPIPKLKDEPDSVPEVKWSSRFKNFIEYCFEKEAPKRATPWQMLEHPWIRHITSKEVDVQLFLKTVWGW